VNYLIFFTVSLILSLKRNPWKNLRMLIQIKLNLEDPISEQENRIIPTTPILLRHRLAIDEAGLEALLCMCLTMGNYTTY